MVWDAGGQTATQRPVAAAMILRRQVLSRGFVRRLCLLYAPKGPLLRWDDQQLRTKVLSDLESLARKEGAILLKIDPDIEVGLRVRIRTRSRKTSNDATGHFLTGRCSSATRLRLI
jgi:lipid II:glycine glycyltransferase (peptidoglycan interpeptide bridge formation enzyme)